MLRCSSVCLLLFMAACGDDGGNNHPPDAPRGSGDAAPVDGPLVDAAPTTGSVNITALSRSNSALPPGTPVQSVLVVALKPDGTLAGTAMTAADGTAKIDGLSDGVSVTAVYPEIGTDNQLATYVGVKVGDHLTFGDHYYSTTANGQDGQFTVNWPAVDGATSYTVASVCNESGTGTSATTLSLGLSGYCQKATSPLVVKAYDDSGALISSIHVVSVASTPGSIVTLTADQWVTETANSFTAKIASLSAETTEADFYFAADYKGLSAYDSFYPDITGGGAMATFSPAAADTPFVEVDLYRTGNYGPQYSYKRGASPLTLTTPTLPWLGALIANNMQAVWLQTSGSAFDAEVLSLHWSTFVQAGGGKGSGGPTRHDWNWTLILPPTSTSFTFPTPPPQLASYLPDSSTNVRGDLTFVDLSSAADYDAVRALPEYRVTDPYDAVRTGDEPSATASEDGGEGFRFQSNARTRSHQFAPAKLLKRALHL